MFLTYYSFPSLRSDIPYIHTRYISHSLVIGKNCRRQKSGAGTKHSACDCLEPRHALMLQRFDADPIQHQRISVLRLDFEQKECSRSSTGCKICECSGRRHCQRARGILPVGTETAWASWVKSRNIHVITRLRK